MLNKLTAVKVGIDSKKEILAESILLKLKNLEPLIIIPDRLTPGINDKIWKRPIYKAVRRVKFLLSVFFTFN